MLRRITVIAMALLVAVQARAEASRDARFAPDNLLAWCIVPYDAKQRGPEERVAMLARLGFKQYAWDWRDHHLAQLPDEIRAAQAAGVRLRAIWLWLDAERDQLGQLAAANQQVLEAVRTAGLTVEFWLGFHDNIFAGLPESERVTRGTAWVRTVLAALEGTGSTVSLYNHGGWSGEAENQLAILRAVDDPRVGIVYNFHHGHHEIEKWPTILQRLRPFLRAVNLNGMRPEGPKILRLGTGTHEAGMIRALAASGYAGPIGVLGHTEEEDVEVVLRENLAGLRALVDDLPSAGDEAR